MTPFTLKPNASRLDLNDRMDWYTQAIEILQVHRIAHLFSEPYLVSLIQHYFRYCEAKKTIPNGVFFLQCIDAFGDRGMRTKSRLVAMLEGREPLEFERDAHNESNRSMRPISREASEERRRAATQRRSSSSGEADLQAVASLMNNLPDDLKNKLPKQSKNQAGFTREQAAEWMLSNRPEEMEHWEDYFTFVGVMPGRGEIYTFRAGHERGLRYPQQPTKKPDLDEQEGQMQ